MIAVTHEPGNAWIDCNDRRLGHQYQGSRVVGLVSYWQCRRCPVSVRLSTILGMPARFRAAHSTSNTKEAA